MLNIEDTISAVNIVGLCVIKPKFSSMLSTTVRKISPSNLLYTKNLQHCSAFKLWKTPVYPNTIVFLSLGRTENKIKSPILQQNL